MSKEVLVTGGTGYVGSHVILQLLERQYRVKAVVRTGKGEQLKSTYPDAGDRLEIVEISDITDADLSNAFRGVDALVHVASPLATTGDAEYILKTAIQGTENVIGQAINSGVKKIVVTSSWAALFEPDLVKAFQPITVDETWWSSAKLEDAKDGQKNHFWAYMASKPLAEQTAWKLAEEAQDVDLTTILPPIIYGGFVPNYPRAKDRSKLGTNEWIYHLMTGGADGSKTYPRVGVGHSISVKDVAKAHVRALEAGPLLNEDGTRRRKRLVPIAGRFTWPEAAAYLKEVRPELKERLEKTENGPKIVSCCEVDMRILKEVVGMSPENMIPWREFVLESVDCLLEWEKGATQT